ncbi:MAG: ABC transporter substrate-binding protein [Chloroflexi bacterium]|nr:ABC transporter substrate-binding protein [Chloroflexota bacterium]
MKRKVIWLVVSGWMVAALLLSACAPAVVEEEKVVPKEEVVTPREEVVPKEVVAPKEVTNLVKWTGTKLDGMVVEKMIEKPRYGGVYVYARPTQPSLWDPTTRGGHISWPLGVTNDTPTVISFTRGPVGTGEWSGIVSVNPDPPYDLTVGSLAESWELPDDSTLIYHVRKGVHWTLEPAKEASRLVGGRQMTADDWVAYFRYAYRKGAYLALNYGYLSDMENPDNSIYVSPTDKWAVVMKFQPGQTASQFIYGGSMHGEILAPEVIEKYGTPIIDWRHVVSNGPFILKEYIDASALTYVRNPNYWMRDPFFPENQLPYVDTYRVLIIPDLSTLMAGMRTGRIDMKDGLNAEDAESLLKTNPELEWVSWVSGTPIVEPRHDVKPFDDLRVRRALRMAINYQEMVDDYYQGKAALFTSPVAPIPDYEDIYIPLEQLPESVQELYGYHPDKARQLLAEAGYPQGFKTEVIAYLATDIDLLQIVKEYWAKIGVDLKIDVRDFSVFNSMSLGFTFKQMRMSNDRSTLIFTMNKYRPNLSDGMRVLDNPVAVPLFTESMERYYDTPKQKRLVTDPLAEVLANLPEAKGLPNWISYVNEQAWFVPLPSPYVYNLWQPWLKNFQGAKNATHWVEGSYVRYLWIDQKMKKAMGR